MINFKSFITAIHNAIISASDSLMDKNVGLLDKYFDEKITEEEEDKKTGVKTSKTILEPKTVILEYPVFSSNGPEMSEVHVPLITLVPLQMSHIEKAVLTAEFEMEIVDGEIELNFTKRKEGGSFLSRPKTTHAKLEVTISPQETTDGLKLIVEGYESILKRQIS